MSEQFESDMNQLIQEQAKSVESMQIAYPQIKNLCSAVASELYKILRELNVENLQEAPEPIQKIKMLADGVTNEPTNMLLRISEAKGFMRAAQTSIEMTKKKNSQKKYLRKELKELPRE